MTEKKGNGRSHKVIENAFVKREPKRFKKKEKPEPPKITRGGIRRLARRGGVKRISLGVYPEINEFMDYFLISILKASAVFAENSQRKTITVIDVVYALKKFGRTLYGYGP